MTLAPCLNPIWNNDMKLAVLRVGVSPISTDDYAKLQDDAHFSDLLDETDDKSLIENVFRYRWQDTVPNRTTLDDIRDELKGDVETVVGHPVEITVDGHFED